MLKKWLPSAIADYDPDLPDILPSQVAGTAPVNVSVLAALVGDDPKVIGEFLQDFRSSAIKITEELKASYAAGQPLQVGAAAHKLKSSARSVGALALGELCAEIELAGQAGQIEALAKLLPRFEAEWLSVEKHLGALALQELPKTK
jgi:HPt (histidine-containing phosphotransfer) domain-containing protein